MMAHKIPGMDVKIIEIEIAIFASEGVLFQASSAPKRFPMKKYRTREMDINPIDHGIALPTTSLTVVGNIARDTPRSREARFLMYLTY